MSEGSGDSGDPVPYTEASAFARLLGSQARVKMLDVFLGKHYTELTVPEIAQLADIHETTVHRNIDDLLDFGIVEHSGKVGRAQQYRLNKDSRVARILGRARAELMEQSDEIPRGIKADRRPATSQSPNRQKSIDEWINENQETGDQELPSPSDITGIQPTGRRRRKIEG